MLHLAGEERALQRIEFLRHVVLAMKIRVVENLAKNFFRQDVLDQHLAYVGGADVGVDRVLGVLEKA